MASSSSSPLIPEDLAPDPSLTYNPARTAGLGAGTLLPTMPATPGAGRDSRSRPEGVPRQPPSEPDERQEADRDDGEIFELHEQLAQGGFGDVWTGVQPSLDRVVALKRLRRDRVEGSSAGDRQAMQEMFRHEALTTAKLEHPNIVPVYQLGTDDAGRAMLAMKLVRGRPWAQLIREDLRMPVDEFMSRHLPILVDVAQAVAYAHSRNILHRDLKPQQVMVGEFGEVLLMDWGLALPFDEDGALMPKLNGSGAPMGSGDTTAVTAAPALAGTPSFMAPEQTRGVPAEIGPWTDLYLLGGILYYLLTGTPPHKASGSVAAFVKASKGEIEPPAERARGRYIPKELVQLALGTLQASVADRQPASVDEFIRAIEDYLSGASRKRRSRELVAEVERRSDTHSDYTELGHRLSRLQEAQALWPENPDVAALRQATLKSYAESALAQKDLALARLQAGQLSLGAERSDLLKRVTVALERRHAVARQRRRLLVALALLATMLIGGALWTARYQRLAAERLAAERDAARDARADATSLMTFMLEDLWLSLARIERLDLLAPIARRAEAYYSKRDLSSLSVAEVANRGAAFLTIGETLHFEGDIQASIDALEKAIDIFGVLSSENEDSPEFLLQYLEALIQLAQSQNDLGDKNEALETLGKHRRRTEAALLERPGDLDLEVNLAQGIDLAGIVLYDLGRLDEAGQAFNLAFEQTDAARRRAPSVDLIYNLAEIEMRRAVILQATGQLEEALTAIEHSLALDQEIMRLEPSSAIPPDSMTRSVHAIILSDLGRSDEAIEILRTSLMTARQLVAEDPGNAERRYGLAHLELELAKVESMMGRQSAAEAAWQRAIDTVEPLRATTDHSYLLDSLVRALLNLGRIDEARPVARDLLAKGWTHQDFHELCERHGIEASD